RIRNSIGRAEDVATNALTPRAYASNGIRDSGDSPRQVASAARRNPIVRRKRSASTRSRPRTSARRPVPTRRWNSSCQRRCVARGAEAGAKHRVETRRGVNRGDAVRVEVDGDRAGVAGPPDPAALARERARDRPHGEERGDDENAAQDEEGLLQAGRLFNGT